MIDTTVVQLLATLVPLSVAVGGALWGAVIYTRQKTMDRLEDLRKKRSEIYSDLLSTIMLLTVDGASARKKFLTLKSTVLLIGSDDSVRALKRFSSLIELGSPKFTPDSSPRIAAYSELAAALRQDVFPETELRAEDLRNFTPFGDDHYGRGATNE